MAHGNAKSENAKDEDFVPTRRSKLNKMKQTMGIPRNVYEKLRNLVTKTNPDVTEFRTLAPRDRKTNS